MTEHHDASRGAPKERAVDADRSAAAEQRRGLAAEIIAMPFEKLASNFLASFTLQRLSSGFGGPPEARNFPRSAADRTLMNEFEHERLDVYRASVEFLAIADQVASALPRGRAYLSDQLRRAATSIALNIAEGAGEFAPADKARFYRIARRSGTESAAILDAARGLALSSAALLDRGRALLLRITAMLTAMVLKLGPSGSGSGSGSGSEPRV
jgi:four helix bundle protein